MGWFNIGKGQRMESELKTDNEDKRWLTKTREEIEKLAKLRAWSKKKQRDERRD